jgi:hypothetical protein
MNKNILAAAVGLNEPVALRRVEPFDSAERHANFPFLEVTPPMLMNASAACKSRRRRCTRARQRKREGLQAKNTGLLWKARQSCRCDHTAEKRGFQLLTDLWSRQIGWRIVRPAFRKCMMR